MMTRRTQYAMRDFVENTLYMHHAGLMSAADAAQQMFLNGVSSDRVIELVGGEA